MSEKKETNEKMEAIIALCKRRGFVYQGSEIYGGLAGTWDYGPLGVALKKNIENLWWKMFIDDREDMYGIDAAILMNPNAWVASGHVGGFSDPLVECTKCKKRYRADHLIEDGKQYKEIIQLISKISSDEWESVGNKLEKAEGMLNLRENLVNKLQTVDLNSSEADEIIAICKTLDKQAREEVKAAKESKHVAESLDNGLQVSNKFLGLVTKIFLKHYVSCKSCGAKDWSEPRPFNMMFKTNVGAMEDAGSVTYLRPETAGGMFVNYKNVVDSMHPRLPFGLGQIGKAFRNEIAPRDFIFRVRELEQMEIEYFVHPATWEEHFEHWRLQMWKFMSAIGLSKEHVHELEVGDGDRAHYSKRTIDFEFDFPFGRKELYGLAYRGDFDLRAHQEGSRVNLEYFDEEKKEKFLPHVIEPSFGVGRTLLAVLSEAYTEDEMGGEKRVYLKFAPEIAPIRVAVFPLLKNKPELVAKAREVYATLRPHMRTLFDDNGNIGKRYRRQDEIGTPWCVTIDFDTLGENPNLLDTVTLRNRDTGAQERVALVDLVDKLQ